MADRLGVDVRYVRRLVAERRIPYIKLGHYLRFEPTKLEEWIDSARVDQLDPAGLANMPARRLRVAR